MSRLFLALLLALALALRLWHIGFGLPAEYHPDEKNKFKAVQLILEGKPYNYFYHPGLLINMTAAASGLMRALGRPVDQPSVILNGRVLMALAGTLSLLPVFLIGARLFGRRAGLFAAAALAVAPMHVIHSRYLKEDVLLVFWILWALAGLTFWLRRTGGLAWLVSAFVAAGLCLATKYVGVIMVIFLTAAIAIQTPGRLTPKTWGWLAAAFVAGFLLGAPQFARLGGVPSGSLAGDIGFELSHGITGESAFKLFAWQRPDLGTWFFIHGLGPGLSWLLALAGAWGLVRALRRIRRYPAAGWLAVAAAVWYLAAELTPLKRGADTGRYVMPCLPLLAILAGGWIYRRSTFTRRGLIILSLLLPLTHTVWISRAMAPDTRELALRWLRAQNLAGPCTVAYYGLRSYYPNVESLGTPAAPVKAVKFSHDFKPADWRVLNEARFLLLSDFALGRFEDFPKLSKGYLKNFKKVRKLFPGCVIIEKDALAQSGFHNPRLELRFREPIPQGKSDPAKSSSK